LFFNIFQTKEANIPVIDLTGFSKYIQKSELTENKDTSYLPKPEMQTNFDTAVSEMEDNMSLAGLKNDIENLPDDKKSV
jgi:hypothetical protein